MPLLLFALYLVAEIAALAWAVSTIGVLWTVVALLAGSIVGFVLVRSQGRKVFADLRRAGRGESSPTTALADGALVASGAILMFVPGLVTSVLGLLLLLPPTRMLVRPVVVALGARRFGALAAAAGAGGRVFGRGHTVVDGVVVEEPGFGFDSTYGTSARGPRQLTVEGEVVDGETGSYRPPR